MYVFFLLFQFILSVTEIDRSHLSLAPCTRSVCSVLVTTISIFVIAATTRADNNNYYAIDTDPSAVCSVGETGCLNIAGLSETQTRVSPSGAESPWSGV